MTGFRIGETPNLQSDMQLNLAEEWACEFFDSVGLSKQLFHNPYKKEIIWEESSDNGVFGSTTYGRMFVNSF